VPDCDLRVQDYLRDEKEIEEVLLNGKKGRYSQIAIATEYWSPMHKDDDVFYTLLTCCAESKLVRKNKKDSVSDDILFWFVFPTIGENGIAFPMRATDILVFDSKFPHCTTNYQCKESFILSCFTSTKTTFAHLCNKALKRKRTTAEF